jgi:hypothetical protein
MSADGSWRFCTHEHLLKHRCFRLLRFATASQSSQQMVHGVCTHEHLLIAASSMRLLQRQSCQQMVHEVFALMNI